MVRDVRTWMLDASGMNLGDLLSSIESVCVTQTLDNQRIRCNRHLHGLNHRPSAYQLLLITSGMTLTDLHAYFPFTGIAMYVHGGSTRQACLLPNDMHLSNRMHDVEAVSGKKSTYSNR